MAEAKPKKTKAKKSEEKDSAAAKTELKPAAVDVFADHEQSNAAEAAKDDEDGGAETGDGETDAEQDGEEAGDGEQDSEEQANEGADAPAKSDEIVTDAATAPPPIPAPQPETNTGGNQKGAPQPAKRYRCKEACRFLNQAWEKGDILPPLPAKVAIPSFFEVVS